MRNKRGHILLKLSIALLLVIAVALAALLFYYVHNTSPVDPSSKEYVTLTVESGSTTNVIADQLEQNGLIKSAFIFRLNSKLRDYDGSYKAGTYGLSPGMDMNEISEVIKSGKSKTKEILVPEGYTEYAVARAVGESGIVSEKDFIKTLENGKYRQKYDFLRNAQKNRRYLEGFLFPDTYQIPVDGDSDTIISAMLDHFAEVYTKDFRNKSRTLGFSDYEIIIIASLIEAESGVDIDRGKVASVIYNRLEEGMPLQIDATVQYALDLSSGRKESLTYDDTEIKSKYNTYKNSGLPPGPICCPGKKSIEAALDPEKTDYLYYVLSDRLDGSHEFSSDADEFEKNKAAYYRALEAEDDGE